MADFIKQHLSGSVWILIEKILHRLFYSHSQTSRTMIISKMDVFGYHHQLSSHTFQSMNSWIIHSIIYSLIKDQHILSQAWSINRFLFKEINILCSQQWEVPCSIGLPTKRRPLLRWKKKVQIWFLLEQKVPSQ